MPRYARLVVPGLPHHVLQRGHDRGPCFHLDADRRFYLEHLRRAADAWGCSVHAYVLMTNHVHLLATPQRPDGLSRMMRDVNQRLAQRINAREHRTGTLWEARFKAILVDADEYLLACYRYIELNPLRAGLVREPREYLWSSHAGNVGDWPDPLVTPHALYMALGVDGRARGRAYRELFRWGLSRADGADIRDATASGQPLGSQRFVAALRARHGAAFPSTGHGGRREGAGRRRRSRSAGG